MFFYSCTGGALKGSFHIFPPFGVVSRLLLSQPGGVAGEGIFRFKESILQSMRLAMSRLAAGLDGQFILESFPAFILPPISSLSS